MNVPPIHIVIVTHNSERELPLCIEYLCRQSSAITSLTVVDSGSQNPAGLQQFLQSIQPDFTINLLLRDNIGYGRANNDGIAALELDRHDNESLVIIMNPDTLLPAHFVDNLRELYSSSSYFDVVSPKLHGFDFTSNEPSGTIDSTGIFRSWYGRWYDRGQGEKDCGKYDRQEQMIALCGALLCCRSRFLQKLSGTTGCIFDPDFQLYKEDIEFGIRANKIGGTLLYEPNLVAYHGRGWNRKRSTIPLQTRLLAARSEILLYRKHPSPYMLWAVLKYVAVRYLNR